MELKFKTVLYTRKCGDKHTSFRDPGMSGEMVGPDELKGLFQPGDSVILQVESL